MESCRRREKGKEDVDNTNIRTVRLMEEEHTAVGGTAVCDRSRVEDKLGSLLCLFPSLLKNGETVRKKKSA
jgi:chorismate-pyruvate lyase